jgi:hypothetical protein
MAVLYPHQNWRFLGSNWPVAAPGLNRQTFFDLAQAYNATPFHGTLWIQPGRYTGNDSYNRPMTITAPLGGVIIDR